MLDKWAFGMSKIERANEMANALSAAAAPTSKSPSGGGEKGAAGAHRSNDLVAEVSNVSLDTRAGFVGRGLQPGPSLLAATKPPPPLLSPCASGEMVVDHGSDEYPDAPVSEKITVKIADLGNGLCWVFFLRKIFLKGK